MTSLNSLVQMNFILKLINWLMILNHTDPGCWSIQVFLSSLCLSSFPAAIWQIRCFTITGNMWKALPWSVLNMLWQIQPLLMWRATHTLEDSLMRTGSINSVMTVSDTWKRNLVFLPMAFFPSISKRIRMGTWRSQRLIFATWRTQV